MVISASILLVTSNEISYSRCIGSRYQLKNMLNINITYRGNTGKKVHLQYKENKKLVRIKAFTCWISSHKLASCQVYWPLVLW